MLTHFKEAVMPETYRVDEFKTQSAVYLCRDKKPKQGPEAFSHHCESIQMS